MSVRAALARGNRDALVELAQRLAAEIDAAESSRDRLPLVRAFLAAVSAIEQLDSAARKATPREPPAPIVEPLDELLDRRYRRAARR